MIAVVVHWELPTGIAANGHSLKKWMTMWGTNLKSFGLDELIFVDIDAADPAWSDVEINFQNFATLDAVRAAYLDHTFVIITEHGTTDLADFVHPATNVLYVVGSDYASSHLTPEEGDSSVRIPCELSQIYSYVSGGIVLYDRYIKG